MSAPSAPVKVKAATLGKLFNNMTDRRIQQLARDGVIPKAARGEYDLVGAVQGYVKFLQERAFGKAQATGDVHAERARFLKINADKAELEHNINAGEYAPFDLLEAAVGQAAAQAGAILKALPKRIKAANPELKAREIRVVEKEINKAAQAIADIRLEKPNPKARR